MKGIFLSIEGIEGLGKSTAVKYIESYLLQTKQDFIITREPGGTLIAEKIRQVLLTVDNSEKMSPKTEALLMFASRAQHIQQKIIPALDAGKWIICDRFVDASYAYQCGGRQIDIKWLEILEKWVVDDIKPTVTILLDASPLIGFERAKHRGSKDRIEQEKIEFFERVRAAYLQRAKNEPSRFKIIDASQTLAKVQMQLKNILDGLVVK